MDFTSILLLLALVILVSGFIARPLRSGVQRIAPSKDDIAYSELLAERERILEALSELDFDYEMGKVPESLYPKQREALVKRGVDVLRLLDERKPAEEKAIEGESVTYDPDDPIEVLIAARRAAKKINIAKYDAKAKYCANCGAELEPGDKFCLSCGKKL